MRSIQAVSYTHLDVYKRQLVGRKAARPDDGEAVRVKNAPRLLAHHAEEGFFQGALAAVSYTHLFLTMK